MPDARVALDEHQVRIGPGRVIFTVDGRSEILGMSPVPDEREQFADRIHNCERRDVL